MNYHDAYIHITDASPSIDGAKALEFLKQQKNIAFNQLNEVFTYVVSVHRMVSVYRQLTH